MQKIVYCCECGEVLTDPYNDDFENELCGDCLCEDWSKSFVKSWEETDHRTEGLEEEYYKKIEKFVDTGF